MRTGLFGGTFDPVHNGHIAVAQMVCSQVELDEIIFVPAGKPRLKASEPLATGNMRMDMVNLAVAPFSMFSATDMEINRQGTTYTIDTIEILSVNREIFLILGTDAVNQIGSWIKPGRILEVCKLVAVERPGVDNMDEKEIEDVTLGASRQVTVLRGDLPEISSTLVRQRVEEGLSIQGMVPVDVEKYILDRGLYRSQGQQ